MKVILVLIGLGLVATGCSPINVGIPLSGVDGWMQVLSDSEARGVPVLSLTW